MIESYRFGEIKIDGKTYTSDVIIYPDRIDSSWWRKTSHELGTYDIPDEVFKQNPDVILVGTGSPGLMKVLPESKKLIESKGIKLIIEDTQKACKTYNQLNKTQKVIALFHLTC
jgi:hypothetical protein